MANVQFQFRYWCRLQHTTPFNLLHTEYKEGAITGVQCQVSDLVQQLQLFTHPERCH